MQFFSGIIRGDASTTGIDKTQSLQMGKTKVENKYIKKEGKDGHSGTGLAVTLHSV